MILSRVSKKSLVSLFFIALVLSWPVFHFGRIYNGYCSAEERWLTEDELFAVAMRNVFHNYPPQRFRIPGVYSKKITKPIQYADFEDFVNRNPDCCSLSATGWKGMTVGFFRRIRGYSGGFVRVEYAADADGITPKDRKWIFSNSSTMTKEKFASYNHKNLSFVPMTNCGKVWRGF